MKKSGYVGLLFLVLFSACSPIQPLTAPPYIISKPQCIIGEKEGYYSAAGIEFFYINIDQKTVTEFEVSFIVYDSVTTQNPFIGSNSIKSSFLGELPPNSKKQLSLSLDEYMYVIPDTPYLLDHFYISRITFDDGSTWEDQNGIYSTRSY